MIEINLKNLIENYNKDLLENLRGFGKEKELLKFWVPSTNDYESFINLIDALFESNQFYFDIIIDKERFDESFIDLIEQFLNNVSIFEKKQQHDNYEFTIEIDNKKYLNHFFKKKTKTSSINFKNIDKTKKVQFYEERDSINPVYIKKLSSFEPKNFYSNKDLRYDNVYKAKIQDSEISLEIINDIIKKAYHNINKDLNFVKLLNMFCEIIHNKNIHEAADHSIIYLEEKIRLANHNIPKKGIILPHQAGNYFSLLNDCIRNIFKKYVMKNNLDFKINKNYFDISEKWKKINYDEKIKKINDILDEIIEKKYLLNKKSVSVNKIENNFRVCLNIDENFRNLLKDKNVLLEIETKVKKLDYTLEIFIEEILDQNKLRLKNSPQNI